MSSVASASPGMGTVGHSRQEVGSVLGMSAVFILSADREGTYMYLSDSIEDVLGYQPQELLGRSCYTTFHPDEIPVLLDVHRRALVDEETACVTYMRLRHASGEWLHCAVEYSTVLDRSVGTITHAENGPLTIKQRLTAREVFEVHVTDEGEYSIRKWSRASQTPSRSPSPPPSIRIDSNDPWPKPIDPAPRTAYLIDRFTDTSRVIYITNDVILSSRGLKDQPFYSIVRPSDRSLVRRHIESVKNWSPVVRTERRSGGLGYAEFYVLKIPDLPPEGHTYPQGTDESERHMPGQEFILVEGIFTGSSDAVVCIINRLDRRKGKRIRDERSAERRPGTSRQNSGAPSSVDTASTAGTSGTSGTSSDLPSGTGAPDYLPDVEEASTREEQGSLRTSSSQERVKERRRTNPESDEDVDVELARMHMGPDAVRYGSDKEDEGRRSRRREVPRGNRDHGGDAGDQAMGEEPDVKERDFGDPREATS